MDLISGNHISPYALVAQGKPIASLASPTNGVTDRLVSREPINSLAQIRGKRVIDTAILDNGGGYNHIRGNHMLYILEAGLELGDVLWVEITDKMSSEFRAGQYEAMKAAGAMSRSSPVTRKGTRRPASPCWSCRGYR